MRMKSFPRGAQELMNVLNHRHLLVAFVTVIDQHKFFGVYGSE
jgi:hypothetical protein